MKGTRIAPGDATDSVQYVVQLHLAGLTCVPLYHSVHDRQCTGKPYCLLAEKVTTVTELCLLDEHRPDMQ